MVTTDIDGKPYRWLEDWAHLPTDEHAHTGWAHHGLAVSRTGELLGFHAGEPFLLVFDADGALVRSISCPVREAHGLTLVLEDDVEYLWIADNGAKPVRQSDGTYKAGHPDTAGHVIKIALDGAVVQELTTPPLPLIRTRPIRRPRLRWMRRGMADRVTCGWPTAMGGASCTDSPQMALT